MLFKQGDHRFNVLSKNVHYLFLFKSPINASKVIHLALQISSYDNKFNVQSYKSATGDNVHICYCIFVRELSKNQLRSKLFPRQATMMVPGSKK